MQPEIQKTGAEKVGFDSRQHIWIIYKILQRLEKEEELTRTMMLHWADDSANAYWTAQLLGVIERRGDHRSIDAGLLHRCIDAGPNLANIVELLSKNNGAITQWHIDKSFKLYTRP